MNTYSLSYKQTKNRKTASRAPSIKSKSSAPKAVPKNSSKSKGFEDDGFELVVSDERNSGSDEEFCTESSKLRVHDENFNKQVKKTDKERSSMTAKKVKHTPQIIKNSTATVKPKPSPDSSRPRFSAGKTLDIS